MDLPTVVKRRAQRTIPFGLRSFQGIPVDSTSIETRAALTKSVLRAARLLELTDVLLATALGLEAADFTRLTHGTYLLDPDTPEGRRALQLVQICIALDSVVGTDPLKLQAWMCSHNESLGAVPMVRIQSPEGLVATLGYLEQVRGLG